MLSDPELAALLDQAARNLDTLELLARAAKNDTALIKQLRERLHDLRVAYTKETNALTRVVLTRAVERRVSGDRRQRREDEAQLVT